jgi:hypothetical protein
MCVLRMYSYHSGTLFFALENVEHNKDEVGHYCYMFYKSWQRRVVRRR